MKILIADDSAVIRAQLSDVLGANGFEISVAEDGTSAWKALESRRFQLAVIDWVMPGLNGIDICRRLANTQLLQCIYVIVLTGKTRPDEMAAAFAAGASDYVTKPFSEVELLARARAGVRIVQLQSKLAQTQKLESIGQLAAGVAHEINTPIQYVGDNTRFFRDTWKDIDSVLRTILEKGTVHLDERLVNNLAFLLDETPTAISQTLDGVERVTQIVRAMKDFAHPNATEKSMVDIHRAIQSTLTVCRNDWKYVADVTTELSNDMPLVPCLAGDINQVFLNLILNAAQAIAERKEGEAKGEIRIRTSVEEGRATIRISDNGVGIPEEIRHLVFNPFFTTKEVGKGSGQGLTIARSIVVDRHGGALEFESKPGCGTTFCISLPLVSSDSETKVEPEHSELTRSMEVLI